jgi:hypothetical protein
LATAKSVNQSAGLGSVMVYMKLLVQTRYGLIANVEGERNVVDRGSLFTADHRWWESPP